MNSLATASTSRVTWSMQLELLLVRPGGAGACVGPSKGMSPRCPAGAPHVGNVMLHLKGAQHQVSGLNSWWGSSEGYY